MEAHIILKKIGFFLSLKILNIFRKGLDEIPCDWPNAIQSILLQRIRLSPSIPSSLIVNGTENQDSNKKISNLLSIFGVAVDIRHIINLRDITNQLNSDIELLTEKYHRCIKDKVNISEGNIVIEHNWRPYDNFTDQNKSILYVRGDRYKWDKGMVDLFHPRYILGKSFYKLENYIESLKIPDILTVAYGGTWALTHSNIYINESVTLTRGFHVDDYTNTSVKVFVYLTNIATLDFGPYCYIFGSHKNNRSFELLNYLVNSFYNCVSTDSNIVNFENAFPILAEAGSIVISNQSGAHRGYPQSPNFKRSIAVFHFSKKIV